MFFHSSRIFLLILKIISIMRLFERMPILLPSFSTITDKSLPGLFLFPSLVITTIIAKFAHHCISNFPLWYHGRQMSCLPSKISSWTFGEKTALSATNENNEQKKDAAVAPMAKKYDKPMEQWPVLNFSALSSCS